MNAMETSHSPSTGDSHMIGQLLLSMGAIPRDLLVQALQEQQATRRPLGEILLSHHWVSRAALMTALARQSGHSVIRLEGLDGPDDVNSGADNPS